MRKAARVVLSVRKAVSFGLITAQSCRVWSCHCAKLSALVLSLRKAARVVLSLRKAVCFGLITAQSCLLWSYHCLKLSPLVLSLRKAARALSYRRPYALNKHALYERVHIRMQMYTTNLRAALHRFCRKLLCSVTSCRDLPPPPGAVGTCPYARRGTDLPPPPGAVGTSFTDSGQFLLSTMRGHVLLSAQWPLRALNAIYACFPCHSPHSSLPLLLSCSVKQDVVGLIEHSSEQRITITTTAAALPSLQGSG